VHWSRSYQRISHRVCKGKSEIALFQHLASKIEDLSTKEEVLEVFKVLAGEEEVSKAVRFITASKLRTVAAELNNTSWKKAKAWKEWWTRERHLRKCKRYQLFSLFSINAETFCLTDVKAYHFRQI